MKSFLKEGSTDLLTWGVATHIVGFSIGKSPRQVQTLLTRAHKYMKDAEEHHKILDLWGWARGGEDQSTPPGKG